MSHITKISTVFIQSIPALRQAILCLKEQGLDCDLIKDAVPRMYYTDQTNKLPYVLKLNKCKYDVGFEKQQDGTYSPVLDTFCNYVKKELGTGAKGEAGHIGKLLREYSKEVTIEDATEQGYVIESCELNKEGQYKVHIAVD